MSFIEKNKLILGILLGFIVVIGTIKTTQAQTVDVTKTDYKAEEILEIVFNCPDKACKLNNNQVLLPKEVLSALNQPVRVKIENLGMGQPLSKNDIIREYLELPNTITPTPTTSYYYNPIKILTWTEEKIKKLDTKAQEPILKIQSNKAVEFKPPQIGKILDSKLTTILILEALQNNLNSIEASFITLNPTKQLGEINSLGINELIARGESNFKGSPKNRRHNINIGIEKLKGLIIAPGEEFSFNKNICPVNKSGGWLPELVIKGKEEGTVPEYGGGLCQVSSTTFRAAMKAGLPIIMRKNHSYAVQYYAPQGSDATTYCGGIDFKFKNDTAQNILIWPYLKDKDNLVFDFYGTKDSRVVELSKPLQYDKKRDGSMKATWERIVKINGETKKDIFKSTYLPPALFHKEEKLDNTAPTTPTPTITPTPTTTPTPPSL